LWSKVADRRTIGVLWDVITFWPRAAHPFAPPCYAERVVPQLLARHEALSRGEGRVLISGHSQGALIGAAVILQLSEAELANTGLITYGCQFSYLYARAFPAYLGSPALGELARRLQVPAESKGIAGTRWINLFRLTDYLGSTVEVNQYADINREVADPPFAQVWTSEALKDVRAEFMASDLNPGDLLYQKAASMHSNYPATREYRQAVDSIATSLDPPYQPTHSRGE
jgi:hypothetical protein